MYHSFRRKTHLSKAMKKIFFWRDGNQTQPKSMRDRLEPWEAHKLNQTCWVCDKTQWKIIEPKKGFYFQALAPPLYLTFLSLITTPLSLSLSSLSLCHESWWDPTNTKLFFLTSLPSDPFHLLSLPSVSFFSFHTFGWTEQLSHLLLLHLSRPLWVFLLLKQKP